jgi:HD-GYP domain-containing protein (c-di-GMP phosphodiesterase class II)
MDLDINQSSFETLGDRIESLHRQVRLFAPEIDRMAVALYDAQSDMLKTFINSTPAGRSLTSHQYLLSDSASLSGLARERSVRHLTDIQHQLRPDTAHSTYVLDEGFVSSLTIPLFHQGDFLGFLFYDSRSAETFTPEIQRELLVYGQVIAMAIAHEVMAVRTIIGTVQMARKMTALRDMETGAHLERMARYSRVLSKAVAGQLGLTDEFVEHVFLYAPLHDIGKIGIPDRILLKPGPLDPEEWAVMMTHSTKGRDMVDSITAGMNIDNLPDDAVMRNIVEFHHEALDGSGYPRGLVGEQIPIESRIVSVADVFDALTSLRPYKSAWTVPEAHDELRAMVRRGKLDGLLVDAFIEHADVVEDIRRSFPEEPGT